MTKIVCPPLKLLQPLIPAPKATMSSKIPRVTKSSTKTQEHLLPSTSSATFTSPSESQPTISVIDTAPPLLIVYLPLLHLPHPQYECLHPYQHVLFLKRPALHPIPYLLRPRMKSNFRTP
ncbi:hypothetical protein TNCV_4138961 [Trichonephila clavipes]|nr:hypothetical protein TNCV_4138961 [Trichonephila clavipes]